MRKNLTTEEFIKRAKKVHGNKFDYSLVNYISTVDPVQIICDVHGPYFQSPNSHLAGSNCPKCSQNKKSNTDEFIEKAKKVHGDYYDYSCTDYKFNNKKVKIRCICHNLIFKQEPASHLAGHGCPKCRRRIRAK